MYFSSQHPTRYVPGAGWQTRLESITQRLNPDSFYDWAFKVPIGSTAELSPPTTLAPISPHLTLAAVTESGSRVWSAPKPHTPHTPIPSEESIVVGSGAYSFTAHYV